MAQFFMPTATVESTGRYYHPTIRNDVALDMSLKKLGEMKSAQRATHRPANLLKTVLVYNMFKAAVALPPVTETVAVLDMEVDEASEEAEVAAEQSWFDRCIDNMLTEDSQEAMEVTSSFCVGEDDEDEDVEDVGGGLLKRSPSLQSLSMLAGDSRCLAIATAAQPPVMVAAAEDMTPGAWQKDGLWPTRDPQTIHANIFTL
ncbi:hypothetical protein IWW39_003081 [Coemansia spiralis]|uniref:Uncharacterized protein n=1 Tax=Coemansia spiralis TaxID=417178 RepID=A0A9W8GEM4_9FUNG|nr:hypothetical protein IWW39_003081 [Coemansia spiralis]